MTDAINLDDWTDPAAPVGEREEAIALARQVRDGDYFAARQRFLEAFEQAIRWRREANDVYEAELTRIDMEFADGAAS
jgi:hypothetical protein